MNKSPKPRLRGRKITRVDWREFLDGRGGKTTDPVFYLDDGSSLHFQVVETESSEYGIEVISVR